MTSERAFFFVRFQPYRFQSFRFNLLHSRCFFCLRNVRFIPTITVSYRIWYLVCTMQISVAYICILNRTDMIRLFILVVNCSARNVLVYCSFIAQKLARQVHLGVIFLAHSFART